MIEVKINAGVCGKTTTVKAESEDGQNAVITIVSDCPMVLSAAGELKEADAYAECFGGFGKGEICAMCAKHIKHAACPVPAGILKAVEAACGLALPADVHMEIRRQ